MLEKLIIEFAEVCIKDSKAFSRNYKPQIIQSLDVLGMNEIIIYPLRNEINELRMRNAFEVYEEKGHEAEKGKRP